MGRAGGYHAPLVRSGPRFMPTIDPRVDAYISTARDSARPILGHVRRIVHEACPDIEDTIKWGKPHNWQYMS